MRELGEDWAGAGPEIETGTWRWAALSCSWGDQLTLRAVVLQWVSVLRMVFIEPVGAGAYTRGYTNRAGRPRSTSTYE